MVLIAEDDMALRFLLSEALRQEGFEVLSATDGIEAVELYRSNAEAVKVVVTDIVMPGMDGLTAAVEMRKIEDNVSFLFMSGHGPERIKEIGISLEDIPNSAFLQKPFAFKDMMNMIWMMESRHDA
jgi:two-component system cell cycle sensor histidine kinase/response regulator CckA